MNDRGFTFIELVVSLMIVSGILFASLTLYQQLNHQSAQVMEEWKAYWRLKGAVRQWQQNDLDSAVEGDSYQIQWSEKYLSSTVLEGEFRIRWTSKIKTREKVYYAYKRAAP